MQWIDEVAGVVAMRHAGTNRTVERCVLWTICSLKSLPMRGSCWF